MPAAIAGALDSKIALIRDQLAEAEALRKEAEALKAEYEARSASADKDREAADARWYRNLPSEWPRLSPRRSDMDDHHFRVAIIGVERIV